MTKTITTSILCAVLLFGCPVSADATKCEGLCSLDCARAQDYDREILIPIKDLVVHLNEKDLSQIFQCFGLSNLGEGQYLAAEHELKEAVLIREKQVRSSSLLLADSLSSLSRVYEKQGNLEQAAAFAMRALKIREKVLALTLADSLENDARHSRQLGHKADAVRKEKRALEIKQGENE